MSPCRSARPDGRGLPKNMAGEAMGVDPRIAKSTSPPHSSTAALAAAAHRSPPAPGGGGRDHRLEGRHAQPPGPADAGLLLGALHHHQLVEEPPQELEGGLRKALPQGGVLVHRKVVVEARVAL